MFAKTVVPITFNDEFKAVEPEIFNIPLISTVLPTKTCEQVDDGSAGFVAV